jgi:hypothetical protein
MGHPILTIIIDCFSKTCRLQTHFSLLCYYCVNLNAPVICTILSIFLTNINL